MNLSVKNMLFARFGLIIVFRIHARKYFDLIFGNNKGIEKLVHPVSSVQFETKPLSFSTLFNVR